MAIELKKYKKKNFGDAKDLHQKVIDRDTEIRVLKEMVRAAKIDRAAREVDISKLQIRIERLDKICKFRE